MNPPKGATVISGAFLYSMLLKTLVVYPNLIACGYDYCYGHARKMK
jgi:hypothetical protein